MDDYSNNIPIFQLEKVYNVTIDPEDYELTVMDPASFEILSQKIEVTSAISPHKSKAQREVRCLS